MNEKDLLERANTLNKLSAECLWKDLQDARKAIGEMREGLKTINQRIAQRYYEEDGWIVLDHIEQDIEKVLASTAKWGSK